MPSLDIVLIIVSTLVLCGAVTGGLIGLLIPFPPGNKALSNFLRGSVAGIPVFIVALVFSFYAVLFADDKIGELKKRFFKKDKVVAGTETPKKEHSSGSKLKKIEKHAKPPHKELTQAEAKMAQKVHEVMAQANNMTGPPGIEFETNDNGFLKNPDDWNAHWVYLIKDQEGIDYLTSEHEEVIVRLKLYYNRHGIAPMVRVLSKVTGFKLKHIYELFPSGPGKGACKMAGLPAPTGCI